MVAFNKKTEGGKQVSTHLSPRGNRTSSGQVHSVWVGVSAPQNAPTSLSATPVNTSVSISFTAPTDNGGMSITNYQYAISTNGGSSYGSYTALSPADGVSPITITGLTQNTAYYIKLKAVNDVGVSDVESSPVSFTTQGIPTSAPSGLSAIQTDTSVAISFTAAASSTALTNYEYSFNNSTWTALSPADAVSPVTISGLSQNTAYTVYLRGVNAYGSGPGSTGVSFTTYGPPTGTTTISSVSVGSTTATVNFSTTAGGGAITGYDYYLTSWVNAGVSTSPISLSGLTANTGYTVYVRPKNAYGVGPQSAGYGFTTAKLAPSSVEVLAAGGGASGAWWAFTAIGYDGGGGGQTSYNAAVPVTAGVTYTITVGGQSSSSSAALGSTVTASGTTGRVGNGNGGTGTYSAPGNAGSNGTSASTTITGVTRLHGGGGGGGIRYGAGYGASGGSGGAGGTTYGLGTGGGGVRGGGGGGSADANVWGGGVGGGGGSGEVIIAYSSSFAAASATTGSPSYSNTSRAGYHVYIFTGSGSITF